MADPVTYAVLHSLGYVGSPIGFRSRITTKLAGGMLVQPPLSGLYPVFDPYSVFRMPQLAGYHRIVFEGKAYAAAGAEDSNGRKDVAALSDAVGIADRVDAGGGTPQDRIARRRIIVFYVRSTP